MAYTTIAKVRELSGFDNSTNIGDSVVSGKIATAESMVASAVGHRYALPIPFHRSITLTFSGTGNGAGNMVVVVNGTNYTVTIANAMTAERAAELFRAAAIDSDDFIVQLNGAVATLISKTSSSDLATADSEVDITDAPTTQGIQGAIGSRLDRHPQIIDQITAEIAASLLLMDNYGVEAEDTPKDGEKRYTIAMATLAQIQGKKDDEVVLSIKDEVTGVEIPSGSTDNPGFYPNNTSKEDDDNPTAAKLSINDIW